MYEILISRSAEKSILKLPQNYQLAVRDAIDELAEIPRPKGVKKMKGNEHRYRIRVGVYRVIYEINGLEMQILVVKVGHRKNVYS